MNESHRIRIHRRSRLHQAHTRHHNAVADPHDLVATARSALEQTVDSPMAASNQNGRKRSKLGCVAFGRNDETVATWCFVTLTGQ